MTPLEIIGLIFLGICLTLFLASNLMAKQTLRDYEVQQAIRERAELNDDQLQ